MKKVYAALLSLLVSANAFATDWDCACLEVDDFGTCMRWKCTPSDGGPDVIDGRRSALPELTQEEVEATVKELLPTATYCSVKVELGEVTFLAVR